MLTDERIESILDDVYGDLGKRDFAGATEHFLEDVKAYVKEGVESGQYTYDRIQARSSVTTASACMRWQ